MLNQKVDIINFFLKTSVLFFNSFHKIICYTKHLYSSVVFVIHFANITSMLKIPGHNWVWIQNKTLKSREKKICAYISVFKKNSKGMILMLIKSRDDLSILFLEFCFDLRLHRAGPLFELCIIWVKIFKKRKLFSLFRKIIACSPFKRYIDYVDYLPIIND